MTSLSPKHCKKEERRKIYDSSDSWTINHRRDLKKSGVQRKKKKRNKGWEHLKSLQMCTKILITNLETVYRVIIKV